MQLERPDDLAAHDGARRRALPDARHAERRLVGADADALRRRHLRQRARRLRLAVRRRRRAQGDGRHARLPAAAGGAARPGAAASIAAETWQKLADDDMARLLDKQPLARRERAARDLPMERAAAERCSTRRSRCGDSSTRSGGDAARRAKTLLVVGHAPFTPGGIVFGDAGLEYTDAVGGGDGRVPLTSALLPGVRTWKLDAVARRPAEGREGVPGLPRAADARRDGAARRLRCVDDRLFAAPATAPARARRRCRGERRAQPAVARPPAVGAAVDAGRRARRRRARRPATARARARRAAPCTSRSSTPTSSSCTSRWSSATTARSR